MVDDGDHRPAGPGCNAQGVEDKHRLDQKQPCTWLWVRGGDGHKKGVKRSAFFAPETPVDLISVATEAVNRSHMVRRKPLVDTAYHPSVGRDVHVRTG